MEEDPFSYAALPTQGNYILGENDLQAIFNDYFFDEYLEKLQTAQVAAAMGMAYDPSGDQLEQPQLVVDGISEGQNQQDVFLAECATTFTQVQQSEVWTPTEYAKVAYQYQDLNMQTDGQEPSLELISEPELVMATDHRGRTTLMASAIMVARDIQGRVCSRLLRVLFDSGGGKSMCHHRILPRGARVDTQGERVLMQTIMGTYSPLGTVEMTGMRFPAFDKNRVVDKHHFHMFQGVCKYDVILGGDYLSKIGMRLKYDTLEIEWLGNTRPMESLNNPPS